jgi:glycosyltransferase involved in cell wall biosynthesis
VDGTPEVVEDGVTGLLAAPGDVEKLAGHLDRLSRDEPLRTDLTRRAEERLGSEFEIRKMVADLDDLYSDLLQRGRG